MSNNSKQSSVASKRVSGSLSQERVNKILRVEHPSFENEINNLLLESDQSDIDEDINDYLVSEADFVQNHETDQEYEESAISTNNDSPGNISSDNDVSLAELQRSQSKYYYGSNRCKWANNPPSSSIRTPQHNIVTGRSGSRLTVDAKKDTISIRERLIDEEMRQTILTWRNAKIDEFRAKFKQQDIYQSN